MASIDKPPKPKPTPEDTPEPTAMELALKKVGIETPPQTEEVVETVDESPKARKAKKPEAFDPRDFTEEARKSYVQIGEELRAQGVEPRDLPAEVFAPANEKIDKIYELADAYRKRTDPKRKKNIVRGMQRAKDVLEGDVVAGIATSVEGELQKRENEKQLRRLAAKEFKKAVAAAPLAAEQKGPAVDKSEFAAPQYGKGGMQKEMDALQEPEPEALPGANEPWSIEMFSNGNQPKEETVPAAPAAPASYSPGFSDVPMYNSMAEAHAAAADSGAVAPSAEAGKREFHPDGSEYLDFVETHDVPVRPEGAPLEGVEPSGKAEQNIGKVSSEFRDDGLEYVTFTPPPEGTPKELKQKLRELVGKFRPGTREKAGKTNEALKENLKERSGELDAEAAKMGGLEKLFRSWGEDYNKLGWKTKLGLGLGLGIGAGALSFVSLPAAVACLSNIALQRIAGMSSAFLKYENSTQDGKWKKEVAMAKAMGQAGLMTGGMMLLVEGVKEGVQYAKETDLGEKMGEWFGNVRGYWHNVFSPEAAPAAEVSHSVGTTEVVPPPGPAAPEIAPHPAPVASVGESVAPVPAETPVVPQTPEQPLVEQEVPPAAPEINPATGLVDEQPPAPVETIVPTPVEEVQMQEEGLLLDGSGQPVLDGEGNPIHTGSYEASSEVTPSVPEASLEQAPEEVSGPAPIDTVDLVQSTVAPELPIEHMTEFTNANDLPIDPLHGHVFADADGATLAYGNSFEERLDVARGFARANPSTSVWVQAEKPIFYEGEWKPWVFEVKYGGFWRGIQEIGADGPVDPSRIHGINPDTFIRQLDEK